MHIRPLPALLLVLPLLMTACNGSHTLKMDARATPANTKPAEVDDLLGDLQSTTVIPEQSRISTYARQVQKAIAAQMNEPNAYAGKNCVIKNSIILNDAYIGDNTHVENCIVESHGTLRANTFYSGDDAVRIVAENNERYML